MISTVAAWKMVKISTMSHAWNHLMKEMDREESQVELENYQDAIETIVELAEVVGVKDFDINNEMEEASSEDENDVDSDVEEVNNDSESDDEERRKPKKRLSLENLKEIQTHFLALIMVIEENDENVERSDRAVHDLSKLLYPYRTECSKSLK